MLLKFSGKTLVLFNLLLLAGCSSNSASNLFPAAGDHPIDIESYPSGADVYVMGEKLGVTPLKISHKDVFPNIYPSEKVSLYGKVTLSKTGCADFTRPISAQISAEGLHAKLDCSEMNPPSPATSANVPRISEPIEQRLDKIKDLLSKGLITEEEAKKARERILNDL